MTYPIPPGPRIAYELDGTVGLVSGNSGSLGPVEVDNLFLKSLNADAPRFARVSTAYWGEHGVTADQNVAPPGSWLALRFPTAMRIRALAFQSHWGAEGQEDILWLNCVIETSEDSTNGQDGTWREIRSYLSSGDLGLYPQRSTDSPTGYANMFGYTRPDGTDTSSTFSTLAWTQTQEHFRKQNGVADAFGWREVAGTATRHVTWLRVRVLSAGAFILNATGSSSAAGAMLKLHLYGEPDTSATEQRLQFVEELTEDWISSFDWGDVYPGLELTKVLRVKNLSTTDTATNVSLGLETSNPNIIGDPFSWLKLSLDEIMWSNAVSLGDLGPEEVSDPVTLRLQVGENIVGPWGPRMVVEVEEWV